MNKNTILHMALQEFVQEIRGELGLYATSSPMDRPILEKEFPQMYRKDLSLHERLMPMQDIGHQNTCMIATSGPEVPTLKFDLLRMNREED